MILPNKILNVLESCDTLKLINIPHGELRKFYLLLLSAGLSIPVIAIADSAPNAYGLIANMLFGNLEILTKQF